MASNDCPTAVPTSNELYFSSLGDDPNLAEIVTRFVEEIPARLREMNSQFIRADWDHLSSLAHQIKGAAGSYGFMQVTPFAARLEESLHGGTPWGPFAPHWKISPPPAVECVLVLRTGIQTAIRWQICAY